MLDFVGNEKAILAGYNSWLQNWRVLLDMLACSLRPGWQQSLALHREPACLEVSPPALLVHHSKNSHSVSCSKNMLKLSMLQRWLITICLSCQKGKVLESAIDFRVMQDHLKPSSFFLFLNSWYLFISLLEMERGFCKWNVMRQVAQVFIEKFLVCPHPNFLGYYNISFAFWGEDSLCFQWMPTLLMVSAIMHDFNFLGIISTCFMIPTRGSD